jgi:hypothetical protein
MNLKKQDLKFKKSKISWKTNENAWINQFTMTKMNDEEIRAE